MRQGRERMCWFIAIWATIISQYLMIKEVKVQEVIGVKLAYQCFSR